MVVTDPDDAVLVATVQGLLESIRPTRDPVAEQAASMVARIGDRISGIPH